MWNKRRKASYQHVNIQEFQDKIKAKTPRLSFQHTERLDAKGNVIEHGGHYKVMFVDEVEDARKQSVAITHEVESYKKYNQQSWWENCWIIF